LIVLSLGRHAPAKAPMYSDGCTPMLRARRSPEPTFACAVVVIGEHGNLTYLYRVIEEAAMNEAVRQLLQLILQGITWVLRTIERLWVWSWSQINSVFHMSWDSLPAWKMVLGVLAMIGLAVILYIMLRHALQAFRRIAEAFWTMVLMF